MYQAIKRLSKNNRLVLKSEGISMLPILQPGDMAFFLNISFRQIKIDNLILAKKNGKMFTHRVIYKTKTFLVCKGDNNLSSDGKIYPRQVIGILKKVVRKGKTIDPDNFYLIQSTIYYQEILKISDSFKKSNINHVFLKGLPLYLAFKRKHPNRVYLDCDVLVGKSDFARAEKILLRAGYKKAGEDFLTSGSPKKQIESAYIKKINGFPVVFDIHCEAAFLMTKLSQLNNLFPQIFVDCLTKELLLKKQKIQINNNVFFFPAAEYLIIYLALHLFHHNFLGAFRYDMLATIILENKSKKDLWKSVRRIIQAHRLNGFIYPVFVLLDQYYSVSLPSSFIKEIRPADNRYYDRLKKINIFDDENRFKSGISRIKNIFLLSPLPWYKKIFIFLNPFLFLFFLALLVKKLFYFFSGKE